MLQQKDAIIHKLEEIAALKRSEEVLAESNATHQQFFANVLRCSQQVLLPSFSAQQTFAKNRKNEADVGGTYYHQMKIQGLQQKFDQVEQSVVKMLERYPS